MEASRDTLAERRAIECCADTLLVHGVPGLVQRREQRVAKVVLVDARGDANVTSGKPTAERMVSEVEPAALEIVAETLRNVQRKIKLGRLGESLPQTGIVYARLLADRAHHRNELAFEFAEQSANRGRGHTLVCVVDVRIGDMIVGHKIGGIDLAFVRDKAASLRSRWSAAPLSMRHKRSRSAKLLAQHDPTES